MRNDGRGKVLFRDEGALTASRGDSRVRVRVRGALLATTLPRPFDQVLRPRKTP
jgi:hypothetical protein